MAKVGDPAADARVVHSAPAQPSQVITTARQSLPRPASPFRKRLQAPGAPCRRCTRFFSEWVLKFNESFRLFDLKRRVRQHSFSVAPERSAWILRERVQHSAELLGRTCNGRPTNSLIRLYLYSCIRPLNQRVEGSSPSAPTKKINDLAH